MGNLFIETLIIKNFKCFKDETIQLNIPDGQKEGSGLNILIGENGTGKTTILEAIDLLTQSPYTAGNRIIINDFNDCNEEILIRAETQEFKCKMPYPDNYFECNGFQFTAKCRDRKAPGKLLSSPFQINNSFLNINENYKNSKGLDSGKPVYDFYKIFNKENIIENEVNIFYFDKNRSRQITTGNYRTTFERICDDLNWKFIKNLNSDEKEEILNNICGEYFKHINQITQKGIGLKVASELSEFFSEKNFKDLKIDLIDLLHPFSNSFFAVRKENEFKQILAKDLGSGIEIILTLLLLNNIAGESKGDIIYLIDEPELHLHPKAQDILIQLLIKESKEKQIIISTHSPYIYKNCLSHDIGLLLFTKENDYNIKISNAKKEDWGVFKWSPSWGEINYHAFNLPTVEFHNELYGALQEKVGMFTEAQFDEFLVKNSIPKSKDWIKIERDGTVLPSKSITLCTYVRNCIHHPENTNNLRFTDEELNESINILIKLNKDNE